MYWYECDALPLSQASRDAKPVLIALHILTCSYSDRHMNSHNQALYKRFASKSYFSFTASLKNHGLRYVLPFPRMPLPFDPLSEGRIERYDLRAATTCALDESASREIVAPSFGRRARQRFFEPDGRGCEVEKGIAVQIGGWVLW